MSAGALAEQVAAGDPDRFAATRAAAPAERDLLWPIYALNLELARAPWAARDPILAEMRLQWWIDAMGAIDRQPAPNAVLAALGPMVTRLPALGPVLHDLAEARRRDAWRAPFADAADLEAHIDATAGSIMWAAALLLGAPAGAESVVRDMAWGGGLANWLRAVPALRAAGWAALPDDRPAALAALAVKGRARISRARSMRGAIPPRVLPALLCAWQADRILALAAAEPSRVAEGRLGLSEARRRASLAWRAISGRW